MKLPARDAAFLGERGLEFELLPDPSAGAYLVIHRFDVAGGGFAPSPVDLMIRIPPQYPMTPLDMWYCDPPIRVATTGQYAPASEVTEAHLGRSWQRFSRHLNDTWRPGIDGLRSYFTLVRAELQGSKNR
jgi:hypothetical protein